MEALATTPTASSADQTVFETEPARYQHWKLSIDNERANLVMAVDDEHPHKPGYELKLNSYDLSVDIELADAILRLRFEHPEIKVLVITAELDRVFCSGANIYMLGLSTHSFKVNFCKFTNETRLYLEDASASSGLASLAACKGTTAGGGYELALACDDIMLVDDGNSAVSFPETPLLAVLPGTGGLTRLVDKRRIRRDRADVFCTTAEGIKGKRAKDWGLVDDVVSRSKWDETVATRAKALAAKQTVTRGPAVKLPALAPKITDQAFTYGHVTLSFDRAARTGELVVRGPDKAGVVDLTSPDTWSLQAFRELDDALLRLRFDLPDIGMVTVRTVGDRSAVITHDEQLASATTGFAREIRLLQRRVLKRFDNTARSFYAVADRADSCFAGSLLELALGADRFYMLIDKDEAIGVALSVANAGFMTMATGLSRLEARFYGDAPRIQALLARKDAVIPSEEAEQLGLATVAADDIDFEDELRIAIEERASLSPDALTGMEQSLRFVGPETLETKIFGRLSAWQNWIFTRANSTGAHGALTLYGQPERPQFQWKRT
ncbi:MAG: benzoyl-CoA-dihydrodiol lyase [Deltaproteobacteria bacterium]|nr:benzoyl-CoA-dihydrodiol lyase [Deltaproteobacteria bacterium]MDQ3297266.1 enoyl-CoA hydratase-related protein [Myxococcota bacterium]